MKRKFVPSHRINKKQIGKPAMIRLRNGAVLFGTVREVRNNGVMFIPVSAKHPLTGKQAKTSLFFFPIIFIPFFFFPGIFLFI
ncbi:hypothetical protein C8P63_104100 [Melghirimyces profundicolus]|uniref:Uncharacterized protein n=1 Tax=Melghirimyces profundicolus TaxID=1242148 RepID=A0A2T6C4M9_9BACL|nr:hypothetical protein [Melghirimyces profundicolus]PTX63255.1 hypothetical protein C8P63_104100 [Melghirimyces profundicolus]